VKSIKISIKGYCGDEIKSDRERKKSNQTAFHKVLDYSSMMKLFTNKS
jgi:hypothetical protein